MADITTIALDIFTYLLQPKICSRGGDFKQVAMVMVPEATVGKYLFPANPVVAPVIQDASSE